MLAVAATSLRLITKGEALEQALTAGEQAIERGRRLTSQLLGFTKPHDLAVQAHDIDQLVIDLQPMLKQVAALNIISYELDAGGVASKVDQAQFDAVWIAIDRHRLVQVSIPLQDNRCECAPTHRGQASQMSLVTEELSR